jgi:hypothetical protein
MTSSSSSSSSSSLFSISEDKKMGSVSSLHGSDLDEYDSVDDDNFGGLYDFDLGVEEQTNDEQNAAWEEKKKATAESKQHGYKWVIVKSRGNYLAVIPAQEQREDSNNENEKDKKDDNARGGKPQAAATAQLKKKNIKDKKKRKERPIYSASVGAATSKTVDKDKKKRKEGPTYNAAPEVASSETTNTIAKDIKCEKKSTAIPDKIPKDIDKRLFDPKRKHKPEYYEIIKLVAPKTRLPAGKTEWTTKDAVFAYCTVCKVPVAYVYRQTGAVSFHYKKYHAKGAKLADHTKVVQEENMREDLEEKAKNEKEIKIEKDPKTEPNNFYPGVQCAATHRCSFGGTVNSLAAASKCVICKNWLHIQCSVSKSKDVFVCPDCVGRMLKEDASTTPSNTPQQQVPVSSFAYS